MASLAAARTILIASSIDRSISAPAARMWPPPPNEAHRAAASTAPRLRTLIFVRSLETSLKRIASSRPAMLLSVSMMPSDSAITALASLSIRRVTSAQASLAGSIQVAGDEPAFHLDAHRRQGQAVELERRLRTHLVDLRSDMTGVGPKSRKPGRIVEGTRRCVLVAKAAGVRQERHVQVGGDGAGNRIAEVVKHLHHHLPDRGRVCIDDVDVAEARVGRMVVDVDERRVRSDAPHSASRPLEVA